MNKGSAVRTPGLQGQPGQPHAGQAAARAITQDWPRHAALACTSVYICVHPCTSVYICVQLADPTLAASSASTTRVSAPATMSALRLSADLRLPPAMYSAAGGRQAQA